MTTVTSPLASVDSRIFPFSEAENGARGSATAARGLGAARTTTRRLARSVEGVPARRAQPGWAGPPWYQARTLSAASDDAARLRRGAVAGARALRARRAKTATATTASDAKPTAASQPVRASLPVPSACDERNRPGRRRRASALPRHDAVAEPRAQEARDDQGEQQVEGDGAEAEPDRAVRRDERDDGVLEADRRVAVGDRRHDMDDDEGEREQREVAVQPGRRRSAASGGAPAGGVSTPRTRTAVRSSRATTPVPRVTYQNVFAIAAAARITLPRPRRASRR